MFSSAGDSSEAIPASSIPEESVGSGSAQGKEIEEKIAALGVDVTTTMSELKAGTPPTFSQEDLMARASEFQDEIGALKNTALIMKLSLALSGLTNRIETVFYFKDLILNRPPPAPVEPAQVGPFKLPKLPVPTFSGQIKEWRSFWDRFMKTVDGYPTLSDVDKLAFLVEALRGPAKNTLAGLSIEGRNYEPAKKLLEEKYGDPETLAAVYYAELNELPEATSGSNQRTTLEIIKKIMSNLDSLKITLNQDNIKNVVLSKFPDNTIIKVLEIVDQRSDLNKSNVEGGDDPATVTGHSLQLYLDSLNTAIKYSERMEAIKRCATNDDDQPPKKMKLAGAMVAGAKKPSRNGSNNSSGSRGKSTPNSGGSSGGSCIFCDKAGHFHRDCPNVKSLKARTRVLGNKRLCVRCLKHRHRDAAQCPRANFECNQCTGEKRKSHLSHMCVDYMIKKFGGSNGANPNHAGAFLETFIGVLPDFNNLSVRGVLDSCSRYSYVDQSLARQVGLKPINKRCVHLCVFGTKNLVTIESGEVRLTIGSAHKPVRKNFSFLVTPCITGDMDTAPEPNIAREILPSGLLYADPDIFSREEHRRPIQIIIGNDNQYSVLFAGVTKTTSFGVTLLSSFFGWIATGEVGGSSSARCPSVLVAANAKMSDKKPNASSRYAKSLPPITKNIVTSSFAMLRETEIDFALQDLWSLEALGIKSSELYETDDVVLENFKATVRLENNRYVVRWPWRQETPQLASNFRMCMARLRSLLDRSSKELLMQYDALLKEQLRLGIIERAPKTTPFLTHYLPHRAVLQKNKLRIVYDASAKTSSGQSLNSLLHRGPLLMENLVGLLLNFRVHCIAITADIEKAFLQLCLNEVDRDCVRFIWLLDVNSLPDRDNIIILRFARVPFGVISSPFLLNVALQMLLTSEPDNALLLSAKDSFYVDNLVKSIQDVESAIDFHDSLKEKLASASFNLRDWMTNDERLTKARGFAPVNNERISVLGLDWDRKSDALYVKISSQAASTNVTKRLALQFFASIYDPLGLLHPCTLNLKLFIQECWKNQFGWDQILPPSFVARWLKITKECSEISSISIPRRYWEHSDTKGTYTLHIFCDASQHAYACCAYLVYVNTETRTRSSALIYSKVRASPIKNKPLLLELSELASTSNPLDKPTSEEEKIAKLTIPKLELMAALIGKRTSTFLLSQLKLSLSKDTFLWTDATTVLQWLHSSTVLPKFVQNRICEIKRTPNLAIRYVPTDENPADVATRGATPSTLGKDHIWWTGPSWLKQEALWPPMPTSTAIFHTPVLVMVAGEAKYKGILTDNFEKRFSSWRKYIHILMYVNRLRFGSTVLRPPLSANNFKYVDEERFLNVQKTFYERHADNNFAKFRLPLQHDEYKYAERILIAELQKKYFSKELRMLKSDSKVRTQPNLDLNLFLDTNGLIRCKGRLQNVSFPWDVIHPILLPRDSPLTEVLLFNLHVENHHIGVSHLLAKLRERFWVTKGRSKVKSVISRCLMCKFWEGGSYKLPSIPPLPLLRVCEAKPFASLGIDYLGPVMIVDGTTTAPVHIALFVCLVTRAVHLEIARDLSADEFLMALQRFVARRGSPQFILSDNASHFTFIQPLVSQLVERRFEISDSRIRDYLNTKDIHWKFIPPYAPWHGGAYERLVALVKRSLKKTYGLQYLDYVQFSTALCLIEDTINDRPLTYTASDEVLLPLTPNNILRPLDMPESQHLGISDNKILESNAENLISIKRNCRLVVSSFWENFRSLYLTSLRERHTTLHRPSKGSVSFSPKKGDIVHIKEPYAPRCDWKVGTIIHLDKRAAVAQVKVKGKVFVRAVSLLYPLEVDPPVSSSNDVADDIATTGKKVCLDHTYSTSPLTGN